METTHKVGFLPGIRWLTTGPLWLVFIKQQLMTPIGLILVGIMFESRLVPLHPSNQFVSFMPGDIFLGAYIAGLIWLAGRILPAEKRRYNSRWWHGCVLAVSIAVACLVTYNEYKGGMYMAAAFLSPTKLYHQAVLWTLCPYLAITTLAALIAGGQWARAKYWQTGLVFTPGLVWLSLFIVDNNLSEATARHKAALAHVNQYSPIWVAIWRWITHS